MLNTAYVLPGVMSVPLPVGMQAGQKVVLLFHQQLNAYQFPWGLPPAGYALLYVEFNTSLFCYSVVLSSADILAGALLLPPLDAPQDSYIKMIFCEVNQSITLAEYPYNSVIDTGAIPSEFDPPFLKSAALLDGSIIASGAVLYSLRLWLSRDVTNVDLDGYVYSTSSLVNAVPALVPNINAGITDGYLKPMQGRAKAITGSTITDELSDYTLEVGAYLEAIAFHFLVVIAPSEIGLPIVTPHAISNTTHWEIFDGVNTTRLPDSLFPASGTVFRERDLEANAVPGSDAQYFTGDNLPVPGFIVLTRGALYGAGAGQETINLLALEAKVKAATRLRRIEVDGYLEWTLRVGDSHVLNDTRGALPGLIRFSINFTPVTLEPVIVGGL